jgi:hypothetical protein
MPKRKRKVKDPVKDCPLKNEPVVTIPKYCYLEGIEIAKKVKPARQRWGKTCEKFLILPGTVRESEADDESAGFPIFDPRTNNDAGPAEIYMVAVRPGLSDADKNKPAKVKADIKGIIDDDKQDHSAKDHLKLTIDRQDTSGLRTKVEGAIDSLNAVEDLKKKIKEEWADFERRQKLFSKGLSYLTESPDQSVSTMKRAVTYADDDEDEDEKDGVNLLGEKSKLEATIFPEDPTLSKIWQQAPVQLAKWCPQKYDWAKELPKLGDILDALYSRNFDPRVYNIRAESCGDAPPEKTEKAAGVLRAKLYVYPAEEYTFQLRVPKAGKASCSYEGRYVDAEGKYKSISSSDVEMAGKTETKEEKEKRDTEAGEREEFVKSSPELYDPEKGEEASAKQEEGKPGDLEEGGTKNEEVSRQEPEEEEEDEAEGGETTLISLDSSNLPWAEKKEGGEEKGGGKEEEEDEDASFKAEVEKFEIKVVRKSQYDAADDKKEEDDTGEKELNLRESAYAIFDVIQSIREVWDKTKGLSFTVGFSLEAEIGFLEGKVDWSWGWRENPRMENAPKNYEDSIKLAEPGRQLNLIVFSQQFKAKLTILRIKLGLKLGIDLTYRGIGFRLALSGTINGQLDYDRTSVREYCPNAGMYFEPEPESWVAAEMKGKVKADSILLSADTLKATGEIETGYGARARRGDTERFSIAYEWRFLGMEFTGELKIKGYKKVEKKISLIDPTDEDAPNKGSFPTYASRTAADYRLQLMAYKKKAWKVRHELQKQMVAVRSAYFAKFFPKQWPKIKAAASQKSNAMVWGDFNDYSADAWVEQLRKIARTTPSGEIAYDTQHTVSRGFSAKSGYASWAARSKVWYPELEGTLYADNTDLDVQGKQMGELLWYVRLLGGYYKRFSMLTEFLIAYCDKAIAAARQEERSAVKGDVDEVEISEDFKEQAALVKSAFNDIMVVPKNHPTATAWKQGKFQECSKRVKDYINDLDMAVVKKQLMDGYDKADVRSGKLNFLYKAEKRNGYFKEDELTNSTIKWARKNW